MLQNLTALTCTSFRPKGLMFMTTLDADRAWNLALLVLPHQGYLRLCPHVDECFWKVDGVPCDLKNSNLVRQCPVCGTLTLSLSNAPAGVVDVQRILSYASVMIASTVNVMEFHSGFDFPVVSLQRWCYREGGLQSWHRWFEMSPGVEISSLVVPVLC